MKPLPRDLAAAADDVMDSIFAIAAREVTATGCDLPTALCHSWGQLHRDYFEVWGLAVLRLKETGNEEQLLYALPEEPAD